MLNIAICDDEPLWLENTASLLKEYRDNHADEPMKIHTFQSVYEIIESVNDNAGSISIFSMWSCRK